MFSDKLKNLLEARLDLYFKDDLSEALKVRDELKAASARRRQRRGIVQTSEYLRDRT